MIATVPGESVSELHLYYVEGRVHVIEYPWVDRSLLILAIAASLPLHCLVVSFVSHAAQVFMSFANISIKAYHAFNTNGND